MSTGKAGWTILLLAIGLSSPAYAVGNSWWGGEVQANQTPVAGNGFGYGRYEVTLKASTGAGSITGFFNLCYANNNYQSCILYNPDETRHLEVDGPEFTPTGNDPGARRWIKDGCTSDSTCEVYHPNPPPRVNGNLRAVSFNTFPSDNQVYYDLKVDPYSQYQTYKFLVLPDKIEWKVQGNNVLSRTEDAQMDVRQYNVNYSKFDTLLREGQLKLVINVWDGTEGRNGGFGGPSSTVQTTGSPAKVQRVAFFPASCTNDRCTIAENPSFLSDFKSERFIKDGQLLSENPSDLCKPADRVGPKTQWAIIKRPDYPVYTSVSHVTCGNNGIELLIRKTESP